MDIVEDYSEADEDDDPARRPKWLNTLMDLNLFWMILLIGVPVLVYCIIASAK